MWFSGSVTEAIGRTRAEGRLLLVFIEGPDQQSISSRESLEAVQETILIHSVPIKLTAGSENAINFSKFYPILVVPATYIITAAGVPIDVIAGDIKVDDFVVRLEKAAEARTAPAASVASSPPAAALSVPGSPAAPSPIQTQAPPPSPASPAQPLLEDKLALAQRKLEELKAKKEKEAEEAERQQELERRQTGKAVITSKRRREEQEMAEAVMERKKDTILEKEHRAKVLAQIELDKAERRKKYATAGSPAADAEVSPSLPDPQPVSQPKVNADETKIQFRFSDGHTLTNVFKSVDKLQSARDFVAITESLSQFTLSQMYPRKTFTDQDMELSFNELELVPTSVLLVMKQSASASYRSQYKPVPATNSSSVVSQGSLGFLSDYVPWFLLLPFITIWNFITSFLPGSVPPAASDHPKKRSEAQPPRANIVEPQPSTSGIRRRDLPSRRGNWECEAVHRLRDDEEDDEEEDGKKKTWNGNSTQQM